MAAAGQSWSTSLPAGPRSGGSGSSGTELEHLTLRWSQEWWQWQQQDRVGAPHSPLVPGVVAVAAAGQSWSTSLPAGPRSGGSGSNGIELEHLTPRWSQEWWQWQQRDRVGAPHSPLVPGVVAVAAAGQSWSTSLPAGPRNGGTGTELEYLTPRWSQEWWQWQ